MPIVIEIDGSSTVMTGSGRGSSGSASVSPMVMSGMPAMAMMSPGPASLGRHPLERLGHQQLGDLDPLDRCRRRGTRRPVWPLRIVPLWTRHSASRPR